MFLRLVLTSWYVHMTCQFAPTCLTVPPLNKAARVNVLPHVGLWPTYIKLNPSWKTEFGKSAWIKPCIHDEAILSFMICDKYFAGIFQQFQQCSCFFCWDPRFHAKWVSISLSESTATDINNLFSFNGYISS